MVETAAGSNDMAGRLEFATTADGESTPTTRFRIDRAGRVDTFADTGNAFEVHAGYTGTTIAIALTKGATDLDSGTKTFQVLANGDVDNTNNSYGAISDAKLKENITDASSQWEDIKSVKVRNFNFIGESDNKQIGVVAQEIEVVSPGLVSDRADLDDDGNDLGTVTKAVKYSVLYVKAVKALQEAIDRIETLEAKVAALEAG